MKPEAQQVAIAEFLGWSDLSFTAPSRGSLIPRLMGRGRLRPSYKLFVPDYLNDLNAMHEAEKTIPNRIDYLEELGAITGSYADAVYATAAQRAEAFLRTIGKWEGSC